MLMISLTTEALLLIFGRMYLLFVIELLSFLNSISFHQLP